MVKESSKIFKKTFGNFFHFQLVLTLWPSLPPTLPQPWCRLTASKPKNWSESEIRQIDQRKVDSTFYRSKILSSEFRPPVFLCLRVGFELLLSKIQTPLLLRNRLVTNQNKFPKMCELKHFNLKIVWIIVTINSYKKSLKGRKKSLAGRTLALPVL